jgi:hypothetical protein
MAWPSAITKRWLLPAGFILMYGNGYSFITFLVNTLFLSLKNKIK